MAALSQTAGAEEEDVKEDDPVVNEEGSKEPPLAFPPLPPPPVAVEPQKGGSWGYQKLDQKWEPSKNFKDIFKAAMHRFTEIALHVAVRATSTGCTAAGMWGVRRQVLPGGRPTKAGMALLTIPQSQQQSQTRQPLPPSRMSQVLSRDEFVAMKESKKDKDKEKASTDKPILEKPIEDKDKDEQGDQTEPASSSCKKKKKGKKPVSKAKAKAKNKPKKAKQPKQVPPPRVRKTRKGK